MFAPLGLFRDIPCPQREECSLIACLFSHRDLNSAPAAQDQVLEQKEPAKLPPKRLKLEPRPEAKETPKDDLRHVSDSGRSTPVKKTTAPATNAENISPVSRQPNIPKNTATAPIKRELNANTGSSIPPRRAPKEALNPRMIQKSPATYNLAKDKALEDKCLILTPDELITMALDEEEKVAKESPTVYSNVVKLRIVKLSRMSKEDWAKELKDYLNKKYYKIKAEPVQKEPKPFKTDLSVEEEIAVASQLITPLQGLEDFGYVTRVPTAEEIEIAKRGVAEAKGWEKCERCNARFQVFPGRREDGTLTSGGTCTYHPGKSFYPPRKKTDHITGTMREGYFTCCNQKLGESSGCTTGATHVYKVSETKRLASILQFEKTPENPDLHNPTPICFDCEMGYTTLGMELIRLTAVSWPEGKKVLDVLVRPLGEVLDLNSRFSGVFPEHYTNALPYSTAPTKSSAPSSSSPSQLQLVSSPAAARTLLFNLLTPSTPLIGHAIDNDLNACRIIHPTVIDTAILYPHPGGGLPYRMSLRTLAKKHLDREIQTGGASGKQGHDSVEDALATGDLVRVKAGLVWGRLKEKGWIVEEGRLVAPDSSSNTVSMQTKLGEGAGAKRAREGTS
ncbi:hypothetical protein AN5013.2 [Aspergillus nidulans FGSC A4]|nr:hypothetical protein AN5013.2 [Aspergillus nidulans FGSC A4]|eukprot:XP_662617.1 hypothetical protein AN5013.2 [Aspergillus nidulans FGSC A4]